MITFDHAIFYRKHFDELILSITMKVSGRGFILIILHIAGGININIISDIVNMDQSTMVTEFSCNKMGSFQLFKKLTGRGYPARILTVNVRDLDYPVPPNKHMFILDLQCENVTNIFDKANMMKLFVSPFRWVFYSHETKLIEHTLSNLHILIDSDVSLLQLHDNESVTFRKIYKRHIDHSFVVEELGYWTKDEGFKDNGIEKNILRRRNDLHRTILNTCIVITNNDSLNHLTDKREKHIDSIAKVNYILVEHLSDIINVTLKYSIQPTWGYKNNESQWSGMIGELTRSEADIGGTPLFFTIDRVEIIDYIAMTTPTRSKFVFREPKLSYVTNVFTLPFDDYVWASTIALVIIIAIILVIITKWEWRKRREMYSNDTGLEDSAIDIAFFSFGAFCQQGAPAIPFSIPGRITTILLFISLMFLYTSYSANIVALLQSSSTSIQTLEHLLKSRLQVGVDDTVFNRFYFPNATEPIRKALYLQKVAIPGKKDNFMTIEDGVRRMRRGLFAFHVETGSGYKLVGEIFQENEKCGLKEIQYLQVIDPWLAIRKNSSYKKLFQNWGISHYSHCGKGSQITYSTHFFRSLRKIQESGLQSREVSLIYTKKPICSSRGTSFISVGLVDCYPAAVVLTGGVIIAIFVWLIELILSHRNDIRKSMKKSTMFRIFRKQ
ncbi:hypothetical protein JTB14_016720 [Gonioctena quinquepunctata]|nr:hypothetical protein JTB14_016720 [Gonioctena quinquepunctata]